MLWHFVKPRSFNRSTYLYYLRTLPRPGDIVVEVDSKHGRGKLSEGIVVLFSDRGDESYELGFTHREQLYGTVYETGVLVSGPLGPEQGPLLYAAGAPLKGYEALVLPARAKALTHPAWVRVAPLLWGGVGEAVRYAYEGGPDPVAREGGIASFPDLRGDWEMVYVLPEEDRESISVLLASVASFELTRVAVLGGLCSKDIEQLDNRFTVFLQPSADLISLASE